MIDSIGIVLPARDEEALLGAALSAVLAARAELVRVEPIWAEPGRVRIVVVLDACSDGSLAVAGSFGAAVEVLEIDVANVGRARRAGVGRLLHHLADPGAQPAPTDARPQRDAVRRAPAAATTRFAPAATRGLWICSTDADTEVPASWLRDHLGAARDGAELVLGRVLPREADLGSQLLARWRREHEGGGRHVFGANLGVRADVYLAAGGFAPLSVGEDVALVRSAELSGAQVLDLPFSVVQTSGRRHGRTPGGLAGYLRTLAE